MSNNEIHQTSLKGHTASVLCLDHSSNDSSLCLLSGSEDCTARLWDLRSSSRAALCIVEKQPVNSVAFASTPLENSVPCNSPFPRNFLVFCAVGNHVYGYDLRKASAPIVREHDYNVSSVLENQEEINQIAVCQNNKKELHIAAADDGGAVRVTSDWDDSPNGRRRILHHDKDRLAMVTCTAFRPTRGRLDLATGGTDCSVHLWDISKPRRPSSSLQMTRNDVGGSQVCNPPMVHSLSWSPSGRLLAAGLGDATCGVMRVSGRTLVEATRLPHDASVASVVFPNFTSSPSNQNHHDRLLVTASNDGAILFWDLGSKIAGDGAVDPSTMFASEMTRTVEDKMADMKIDKDDAQEASSSILFGIPHNQKPNWLTSSGGSNSPPSIFVADTTNNITAYTLPIR